MKFSPLGAPKVVILTTFVAAIDEDFVKMIFLLQYGSLKIISNIGLFDQRRRRLYSKTYT